MNTRSYAKLFSSIVTSSMWSEDSDTRVVWVTMLALKDQYGEITASVPGLSRLANVSLDACRKALDTFLKPDPHSRTVDNDGRRIVEIPGGWRVLNHELYRKLMDEDERREYKRTHEASRRAAARAACESVDTLCGQNGQKWTKWTHTDTDTDTETKGGVPPNPPPPRFSKKNENRKPVEKEEMPLWKKLKVLDAAKQDHACNPSSSKHNGNATLEQKAEYREICKRLKELKGEETKKALSV